MGHVRNYAMGDVVARYKRAKGSTSCIRWAGTPSACRPKTRRCRTRFIRATGPMPTSTTMRGQLKIMGLSLDWSREFATCDVDYYKQQRAVPGFP
jgi:leucyl-tRNA synthetase